MNDEILQARKAGLRLLVFGACLEVVGLILMVIVDRESGGAVTHANVGRTGYGIPFIAGLPGTIGYLCSVVGLYRILSGRGPGHESRSIPAILVRLLGAIVAVAVFFVATFAIVMKMRG
jgi:hypothetical protein